MGSKHDLKPIAAILLVVLVLPGSHPGRAPLFTLLSPRVTGVEFTNPIVESDTLNVLEYEYLYNGGGVAAGDINNDGLPDLFFTSSMSDDALYLNEGGLKFRDITKDARVGGRAGWSTGVTMADVNGDGWLDIYVCRSGRGSDNSRRNLLYINNGNLTFSERGARYRLDDPSNSTHASFFDYDRDGDLDVFVANHSIRRFNRFDAELIRRQRDPYAGDKLFRNDDGRFVDVSVDAGIIGNPIGFGLSATVSDINKDGWLDIYVTNDYVEDDYLYLNRGDGTFKEDIRSWLTQTSLSSMGSDIADFNNDALPDIMVLDMLAEDNYRRKVLKGPDGWMLYRQMLDNGYHHQFMRNTLHRNDGVGAFSEIGRLAGVATTDWSWSVLLADLDNDGRKDIFITNGYLRDYTNLDVLKITAQNFFAEQRERRKRRPLFDLVKEMPSTPIVNYVFRNEGDLSFSKQTVPWGFGQRTLSNGAAYADLDDDGDLDLVVSNINSNPFIYRNNLDGRDGSNYLKVRLFGTGANRFGVGAKVEVLAPDGRVFYQEAIASRGFQSSVDPTLTFGVGRLDRVGVRVVWPDGASQDITSVETNRTIDLSRDGATNNRSDSPAPPGPYFLALPDRLGIEFVHEENEFVDFEREPMIPHMLSRLGPAMVTGDVNGDQLADIIIGGGTGQAAALYLQSAEGRFSAVDVDAFVEDARFEDTDVTFLDADGDGDADLYFVSGGNEETGESEVYQDRLYLNNGFGGFARDVNALPTITASGGAVAAHDYDGDGDVDLFVGGRVTPGGYPLSPRSYLMENRQGRFVDVTERAAPDLLRPGMVSDAEWADVDDDGRAELVVVGEWMPVRIFRVTPDHQLRETTASAGLEGTNGWWNRIVGRDLDGDGDTDLVAGNRGDNSLLRAGVDEPVRMYAADFDGNGTVDPIISHYIGGKSYPLATRDELVEQLPGLADRWPTYEPYARADISDVLSRRQMANALRLEASYFETVVFENVGGGRFESRRLPVEAQVAPVNDIVIADFDGDARLDLLLAGNNFEVRPQEGRFDAGRGTLLLGDGNFGFRTVKTVDTGFFAPWNVRRMSMVNTTRGSAILVANNADGVAAFGVLGPQRAAPTTGSSR